MQDEVARQRIALSILDARLPLCPVPHTFFSAASADLGFLIFRLGRSSSLRGSSPNLLTESQIVTTRKQIER